MSIKNMVEFVTDLVFGDDGVAKGKGTGERPIEPLVGWHFGFYSRPKDNARGFVVKADGEGNAAVLFCFRDQQYELSLEKGEVGAKNAFEAYWLLNKDGVLELNGTDYDLPKWNDFLDDFNGFLATLVTIITSGTVAGPLLGLAAAAPPNDNGYVTNADALAGEVAKFATLVPYKSTKVKNG